jgi:hypothetical protein
VNDRLRLVRRLAVLAAVLALVFAVREVLFRAHARESADK